MSRAEQGKIFSNAMLVVAGLLFVTAIGFWSAGSEWLSPKVIVSLLLSAIAFAFALAGFLQMSSAEKKEKRENEARTALVKEAEAEKERAAKIEAEKSPFDYY
jgi:hypothetical protein